VASLGIKAMFLISFFFFFFYVVYSSFANEFWRLLYCFIFDGRWLLILTLIFLMFRFKLELSYFDRDFSFNWICREWLVFALVLLYLGGMLFCLELFSWFFLDPCVFLFAPLLTGFALCCGWCSAATHWQAKVRSPSRETDRGALSSET